MDTTFDLKSESLCRSLAETTAWCDSQQIRATIEETDEVKHRREMGRHASELIRRAYAERGGFWNRLLRRKYTDSHSWRRAMELNRRADLGSIAPLAEQLRSAALRPAMSLAGARTRQKIEEIVQSVVEKRSEFFRNAEISGGADTGRFLLYYPEENLADGAAVYPSMGFFDGDNVPPWDTWVAFSYETLLSWVPPQLVHLAQSGIAVNPECCIRWME
jgi:hypothetical protein